jgi:hypothetical protein
MKRPTKSTRPLRALDHASLATVAGGATDGAIDILPDGGVKPPPKKTLRLVWVWTPIGFRAVYKYI